MSRPCRNFAPEEKEGLLGHSWPDNIRDLENAVQRSIELSDGVKIGVSDLFEAQKAPRFDGGSNILAHRPRDDSELDLGETLDEIEASYIKKALDIADGNFAKTSGPVRLSLLLVPIQSETPWDRKENVKSTES